MTRLIAVAVAVVVGATGICRADDVRPVAAAGADRALRAVLYEEDPTTNGTQFVGSAVWYTDNVASAPGQPPEIIVRADIEIPDPGMTVTLDLRRNDDKSLRASHVVEIVFTLPPDFPHGEISNVPGILMKESETARGDSLKGVTVKVTNNFFLFGLSSVGADRQRNCRILPACCG